MYLVYPCLFAEVSCMAKIKCTVQKYEMFVKHISATPINMIDAAYPGFRHSGYLHPWQIQFVFCFSSFLITIFSG